MMDLVTNHTSLIIGIIVFLALIGAPIFACMAALAAVGAANLDFRPPPFLLADYSLFVAKFGNGLTKVQSLATGQGASTLSTIPLFTFAGYVMAESQTAARLVKFAQALVGWIPGGLALVTIVACAIFTTFTGASGVTIVAIGGLIMPALLKEGYKEKFSLGLVTGTGSIGLLFPPALPLIVYGIVYGMTSQTGGGDAAGAASDTMALTKFSVEKFLFAGIVPGLVLMTIIGGYAVYIAIRDKVPRTKFDAHAAGMATLEALPELCIPILIILTLAKGWLQIPEAASLTAVYVLFVEGLYYRDVRLRDLPKIAREALGLVGAIFVIIVAATALTDYFINANVPDKLYGALERGFAMPLNPVLGVLAATVILAVQWSKKPVRIAAAAAVFAGFVFVVPTWHAHVPAIESKYTFLLALNGLLLVVGCLMDIFSAIVVVVPLIAPAAMRYGIDPYHLGVIFLLNLEIGYLTPPVGLNLFISSFRFEKPMTHVVRASTPFLLLMLLALGLVTYVPWLTPIKAGSGKDKNKQQPAEVQADGPGAQDGGPRLAKEIKFPDGGVWTPDRCEVPEIKDDALAYLECQNMFSLWAKCQAMTEQLDKLECEGKVLDGEDPFAEEEEEEAEEEADAAPETDGEGEADAGPETDGEGEPDETGAGPVDAGPKTP